jgi:hypothetical protein
MANPIIEDALEQAGQPLQPSSGNPYLDDLLSEQKRRQPQGPAPLAPPPAVPPPANPYLQDILDDRRGRDARLRTTLNLAPDLDPKQAADILERSRILGLPSDVIQRNWETYQAMPSDQQRKWLLDSAELAEWLTRQDAVTVGAVKGDLQHLSSLSRISRNTAGALGASWWDVGAGFWGAVRAAAENLDVATQAIAARTLPGFQATRTPLGTAAEFATGAQRIAAVKAELTQGPMTGAGPVEQAVYGGIRSVGQVVQFAPFGPAGVLAGLGVTTGGTAYAGAREQGVRSGPAALHAGFHAAVEVATERIPVGLLFKGVKEGASFFKLIGQQLATEIPGEQVATLLQDWSDWVTLPSNQQKTGADFLAERPSQAAATLVSTVTATALMSSGARIAARAMDESGKVAAESTTVQSLPHVAIDALKAATGEASVYVDLPTWTEFFQGKGIDPAEMAATVTGSQQAYADAVQTGEALKIPEASYRVHIAPQFAELNQEFRRAPGVANAKEEEAVATELGAKDEPATEGEQPRPIFEHAFQQFTEGGRFKPAEAEQYAQLVEAGFTTLAQRFGLDPMAVYQRYGLAVTRETAAQAAAAKQPTLTQRVAQFFQGDKAKPQTFTPAFQLWFGESKAVDAQGQPQVMYHGTARSFDTFDVAHAGETRGVAGEKALFFSTTPDTANHSASVAGVGLSERTGQAFAAKMLNESLGIEFPEVGSVVYPVYLKIENPFISSMEFYNSREMVKEIARAKKAGHDGIIFPKITTAGEAGTVAVFSPSQVKSAIGNQGTFDPKNPSILLQGERAALRIDDATLKRTMVLFEKADLSSVIHESAHLFLDVFADVSAEVAAIDAAKHTPEQARTLTDFAALLKWSGFEGSLSDWRSLSTEAKTPFHEKFAEAFESYVRDGKAPSVALRGAFARFRSWLLALVKHLRTTVEFSPEVRAIVDRMLATDEAIAQVAQEADLSPMFLTPEGMGYTPEQFDRYTATITKAHQQAVETLETRLLQDVRRENTAAWKERKAEVQAQVQADVYAEPVYLALSAIKDGTTPAGVSLTDGDPKPNPLSKHTIQSNYPGRLSELPKGLTTTELGGLTPSEAAELFGFDSGDALLNALASAEPMARKVVRLTNERMLAEHGSMLLDGTLHEQARAAIINDHAETIVYEELKALRKMQARSPVTTLRAGIPDLGFFARQAADRLSRTIVQNLTPQTYWVAARKASKEATEAAGKNDFDAAVSAKHRELLNLALFRQSMQLQDEIQKRAKQARDLTKPKKLAKLGLAGDSFIEQARAILERYSFVSMTKTELAARAADPEKWAAAQRARGLPVDLPTALGTPATPYQTLSTEEFLGITDGLRQIVHAANIENRFVKIGNKAVLDEVRQETADHIAAKTPPKGGRVHEVTDADKRRISVASWFATHTKLSQFIHELDGSETGGKVWELVGRPLNEADDWKRDRNTKEAKAYTAILDAHYTRSERAEFSIAREIPGTTFSLTKEARIAIVLNMGNADNLARLQTDPQRKYTPVELEAIAATLDERDTRFVQATWDYLETFWPEIAAKEKRLTGLEPKKVAAVPLVTKSGTLRGGYYPIAYDSKLAARPGMLDIAADGKLTATAGYGRMTTERGHTEERLKTVSMPLLLELTVVGQHVDQVVHDLAFHETLIDVTRLLNGKVVEQAISASHGPLVYAQIMGAVKDIAHGYVPARTSADKLFNWMKTGSQIAAMGYNAWTAAQQPLGNANTLAVLGAGDYHYYFKGLARFGKDAGSQESTLAWIRSNSAFMRQRESNLNQEMSDLREAFRKEGGWFNRLLLQVTGDAVTQEQLGDSFMWHIGKAQLLADIPAWLAGYEQAMDAMRRQGPAAIDEEKAFRLADQLVLDSQGGGSIKDMAEIQRGGPAMRAWLTFYSYANLVFQQTRRIHGRTDYQSPASVAKALSDLSLVYVAPAIGTTVLAAILKGAWPDDEEEWFWAIAGESMSTAMGTMAVVRDVSTIARALTDADTAVRGYEGPAGTRVLVSVVRAAQQVEQGEIDAALARSLNSVAGTVFRYPASQAQRTAEGVAALIEDRTQNPLALIFGPKRDQ